MPHATPMTSYQAAKQVSAHSLTPVQQATRIGFQRSSDFRLLPTIKHPHLSECHSLAEYLHLGLLEGDPEVTAFVPQPFRLSIRGKSYTPDCYVVRNGQRIVYELKPRGEFDDDKRIPLTAYFECRQMTFDVLANETVVEQEKLARHWIEIIKTLYLGRDVGDEQDEIELLARISDYPLQQCCFGDLVDREDRDRSWRQELACLRLLHRGMLTANLTDKRLDFDTEISL